MGFAWPSELTDLIPDALLIIDGQGSIVWSNLQASKLLGYTQEELEQLSIESLVPPEFRKDHVHKREHFFNSPSNRPLNATLGTLKALTKDGKSIPVDISLSHFEHENKTWVFAAVRDVSEQLNQRQKILESERLIQHSHSNALLGTWDWDIEKGHAKWSQDLFKLFGISSEDNCMTHKKFLSLIHPEDAHRVEAAAETAMIADIPNQVEYRIQRPDGETLHVLQNGAVYRDSSGKPERMLGTIQDVTQEKSTQRRLNLSQTIFSHTSEGLLIVDGQGCIVEVNPALCNLTGFSTTELIGSHASHLLPREQGLFKYRDCLRSLQSNASWQGEINCRCKNSPPLTCLASITTVNTHRDSFTHYVASIRDISLLKKNEDQLQYLAHYDQLTQLPNRTLFLQSLDEALEYATIKSTEVAVFYIDLDGFKQVNDTQGHNAGDELLQRIADLLRAIAPDDAMVARLAGDEFALLISCAECADCVQPIAQSLVDTLNISMEYPDCILEISASVGVAIFPDDGVEALDFISKADKAMYQAKNQGRNNFQRYDPEQGEKIIQRIQLLSDMRTAINEQQFLLHYQPKYDLSDQLVGAEALVRWQHPERGMVSPLDFIPLAEDSGLILNIGELIFDMACQFAAKWQQASNLPLRIAINLSARQLHERSLIKTIETSIANAGISSANIELEITESVVMGDVTACLEILSQLQQSGFSIAIDDFGTGYSSLSYLKRLPVDTLKIDREFIASLPEDVDDCSIVTAITSMAHTLGKKVVAEGVETEAQRLFLKDLGCEEIQGYLISKPLPAEEFFSIYSDIMPANNPAKMVNS